MKNHFYKFISLLLCFTLALTLSAQDDHGHTHDEPTATEAGTEANMFIVYAESQKYELTLKHGEISPGEGAELTLYIADFQTNRPLENVTLSVTVQEDPTMTLTTEAHEPGVYHIDGSFPEVRSYSLAIQLNSETHGADLLLLTPVEVGKAPPAAGDDSEVHVHAPHGLSQWLIYGLVFLGGLAVGAILLRRKPKALAVLLIGLSIPVTLNEVHAHEGHNDEEEGTAGNSVFIPKETQFLFDLLTQQVKPGSFQPALEIYGTVVPSPGGYVEVISPQQAQIVSLSITPGQQVRAGQIIAVLKPTSNQAEQVGIAAETGRLNVDIEAAQSELAAAQKEYQRLQAIADIAARKDIQAAQARLNSAEANLSALRAIQDGSVAVARNNIVLKSPINGVVGQFTLSPGTAVASGFTLFTVTNLNNVFIEAQVYDRDAEIVNQAERYTATCSNADHGTADVRMVGSALEVNQTNQSQKVLFELLNPEQEFKIGEFVTIRAFQRNTDRVIFIPNSALSEINGKPVVFIKDAPEMYTVRYIALGQDNGTHTIVSKGLAESERFVTSATYQVKMMMLNQ